MHGKNTVRNTGHPSIIFIKNKDGTYAKSGLLYQDILKYCMDGKYKENDNKSFRLWNLTKWLLEVNRVHKLLWGWIYKELYNRQQNRR